MTTIPERVAFIRRIHLFSKLTEDDLNDVAEALEDQSYEPGAHIIEQGSHGDAFYIVYHGFVRVTRRRDNKDVILAQLGPQDYFGEEELFRGRARSASISAVTETKVLMLHQNKLAELMRRAPAVKPSFDVVIESHKLWRRLQFKWIRPGESVYFLARKHPILLWRALVAPIFVFLGVILFFLWGIAAGISLTMIIGGAAVLAVIGWVVWLVIDWGNDYYIVTNQRVIWMEKVVGIFESRTEAPLSTILSVGVETDYLGRMLGYGHVIIRTFVGQIPFRFVVNPYHAASMIEEYWGRIKSQHSAVEKDAFKNAIRKQLGLPIPAQPEPPKVEETLFPRLRRPSVIRIALSNFFKLRLEEGETVIYRKHIFVLWQHVWKQTIILLAMIGFGVMRAISLAKDPNAVVMGWVGNKFQVDSMILSLPLLIVPIIIWWGWEYVDWTNDIFQVTQEQVIDIDKKPFGTEQRRAAPLENILSTKAQRIGLLGNIFNFGTVYITVGGATLEFQDVYDPISVQSDIDRRRMARQTAKGAAAVTAERERMAEWVAAYHRNVNEFRQQEEEIKKQKPQ